MLDFVRAPLETTLDGEFFRDTLASILAKFNLSWCYVVSLGVDNCDTMKRTLRLVKAFKGEANLLDGMCVLHITNISSSKGTAGLLILPAFRTDMRNLMFTRTMRSSLLQSGIHHLYTLRPCDTRWLSVYQSLWFSIHYYTKLVDWCVGILTDSKLKPALIQKVVAVSTHLVNPGMLAECMLVERTLKHARDILTQQGQSLGRDFLQQRKDLLVDLGKYTRRSDVVGFLTNCVAELGGSMVDEEEPDCDRVVGKYYAKTSIDRFTKGLRLAAQAWTDHYLESIEQSIWLRELLRPTSFVRNIQQECPFRNWAVMYPPESPVRRFFLINSKILKRPADYVGEWDAYVAKVKATADVLRKSKGGSDDRATDLAFWTDAKASCPDLNSLADVLEAYSDNNGPVESAVSHLHTGEEPCRNRGQDEYFRTVSLASILPNEAFYLLRKPRKRVDVRDAMTGKYNWKKGEVTQCQYPTEAIAVLRDLVVAKIQEYRDEDEKRAARGMDPKERFTRLVPYVARRDEEEEEEDGALEDGRDDDVDNLLGDPGVVDGAESAGSESDSDDDIFDDGADHPLWEDGSDDEGGEEEEEGEEDGGLINPSVVRDIDMHGILDNGLVSFHVIWDDNDDDWVCVDVIRDWVAGPILIQKYMNTLDEDDAVELATYSEQWVPNRVAGRRRRAPSDDATGRDNIIVAER